MAKVTASPTKETFPVTQQQHPSQVGYRGVQWQYKLYNSPTAHNRSIQAELNCPFKKPR